MNKGHLYLFGILLFIVSSCVLPSTEIQDTKIPEEITLDTTVPEITLPEGAIEAGVYQTDLYRFNIPDGWGVTESQAEHYDLNTKKNVTIHNKSSAKESAAFFTISSAPIANGETLQSLFDQAYKKGPEIENAIVNTYEKDTFSGIDVTYGRPWGEPRWLFHDIWLENGGSVYVLTAQSYPNSYETHADTFDSIMESFSFK